MKRIFSQKQVFADSLRNVLVRAIYDAKVQHPRAKFSEMIFTIENRRKVQWKIINHLEHKL